MLQSAPVGNLAQRLHATREAFTRNVFKIAVEGVTGRHVEVGKGAAHLFQAHVAALRDRQRTSEHIRRVFEDTSHLFVTLNEELVAVELHPVWILDRLGGLYAEHYILGVSIVFAQVMTVVGG